MENQSDYDHEKPRSMVAATAANKENEEILLTAKEEGKVHRKTTTEF
jgi:hypothetical protein